MKKNLALVTGATSGIGYSAAKQLVQDGWSHVIVTGRSQTRVDEVVNILATDTGTQNITGIALDLDSFASVKKAVAELVKLVVPIDFLVLNVGLIPGKERVVTSENILSSQAPLIGHHQLTLGLLAAGLLARVIPLAGDELSVGDIIGTFKTVTGHKPWVAPIPAFVAKKMMPKEFLDMFRWIREKGFKADIAQVRQEYPQLLTFAGWVKKYTDEH